VSGHHKLFRRNKLTLHHFRAMLYSLASEILEFSLCILRVHNSSDHEIVEHHAGSSPLLQTAHCMFVFLQPCHAAALLFIFCRISGKISPRSFTSSFGATARFILEKFLVLQSLCLVFKEASRIYPYKGFEENCRGNQADVWSKQSKSSKEIQSGNQDGEEADVWKCSKKPQTGNRDGEEADEEGGEVGAA